MSTKLVPFAPLGTQSASRWLANSAKTTMLKISKLTDYGLLATVYLVRHSGRTVSAREISDFYALPLPVVSKVLKVLQEGGAISSRRGAGGGYTFEGDADHVTLSDLLAILEGPWDLVECETTDDAGHAVCAIRSACPSRGFMFGINRAVKSAFDRVSLTDLARGTFPNEIWTASPASGAGAETSA